MEEVKEQLKVDRMSKAERSAYYKHLDNIVILRDNIYTEREEGRLEGRAEGREEGREEERRQNARRMKDLGLPAETISTVTGLTLEEVAEL